MIRIAIVDDHPIVTDGIVANLRADADLSVVATGTSADDALAVVQHERPDVLVLDLELGDGNALDAIATLKVVSPATRIVIFSAYAGEERVAAAFERGADSYVLKGTSSDELLAAIRAAARGETYVPADIAAQLARAVRAPRERLTVREREILALLAEGLSNRAIGERLGIAERTVKFHVGEILGRLGASNRAQAVAIAQSRGLV
ncbi:MAG TPA: response regulator transcription factor [Candidatus Limnocylindria bacterium]|jgi:DNA-binding NarL/FixJ family response regulator|nr:response regulator transcription factor [Candidatus Limnocylindria bacterium]